MFKLSKETKLTLKREWFELYWLVGIFVFIGFYVDFGLESALGLLLIMIVCSPERPEE